MKNQIAATVRHATFIEEDDRASIALALADMLAESDPDFDYDSFLRAATGAGERVVRTIVEGYDSEDAHPEHRHNPAPFCAKCGGPCEMPNTPPTTQSESR